MSLKAFLLALSVVAIWGANVGIGKVAAMQVPPLAFLSIRFILTAMIFLPFAKVTRKDVHGLVKVAILLNVGHYGLVFPSMKFLDASALAVILPTYVPISVLLGWLVFKEKISVISALGIVISFLGLLVVFGMPELDPFGSALAFGSCVAFALGGIEMKKLGKVNLPAFMAYTTLISSPFLAVFSLFLEKDVVSKFEAANAWEIGAVLAYQIIFGCYGMMMWQRLLAENDVHKIMPMTLLQPIFGILSGIVLFGEHLTYQLLAGGLLTMLGVAMVVVKRPEKVEVLTD